MKEIVAARLGGSFVTNNPETIIKAANTDTAIEFFDRDFAKRMAYILGGQWEKIAEGQTLCLQDEQGELHPNSALSGNFKD